MSARVVWFRILGWADGAGANAFLWATGTPSAYPSGSGAASPTLLEVPGAVSSSIRPLEPIASDSQITVRLLRDASTDPLVAAYRAPSTTSTGSPSRLREGVGPTDTTIKVTETYSTAGDTIYIDREAMLVTDATMDTYTVDRGARASVPTCHTMTARVWPSDPSYGPRIYTTTPDAVGQWCELGYSEAGVAYTVWRGVVESITLADGATVEISALSLMQALRSRTVREPMALWTAARTVDTGSSDVVFVGPSGRLYDDSLPNRNNEIARSNFDPPYVWFDRDVYPTLPGDGGDTPYLRCVNVATGAWIVVRAEWGADPDWSFASSPVVRARQYNLPNPMTFADVVQIGDADGVLLIPEQRQWREFASSVAYAAAQDQRWTYVPVVSASLSDAVAQILTSMIPGWGAGVPSAWVDSAGVATASAETLLALDTVDHTAASEIAWIWPAPSTDPAPALLSYLTDALLRPCGIAIAHDDGELRAFDWGNSDTAVDTASAATARDRGYRWQVDAYTGASIARLTYRATTQVVATDRSGGSVVGTAAVDIAAPSIPQVAALVPRWGALTYRYGSALPVLTLRMRTGVVRVGSTIAITRPDMPAYGGGDMRNPEGVVIQRGRALGTDVDELAIVVTNWIEDAPPKRWAPTGLIADVDDNGDGSYNVTLGADFSADDAATFFAQGAASVAVQRLDSSGLIVESNNTIEPKSAGVVTLYPATAPTVGEYLVLETWANAATDDHNRWAWLADDTGLINGDTAADLWGP